MATRTCSLTYGGVLDLTGYEPVPEGQDYWFETSADGTDWGDPEAVVEELQSQLLDGSLGAVSSYNNREATVMVRVKARGGDALAQGEAALMRQAYRKGQNTLRWQPPGAGAKPVVFDVVYGVLEQEMDDQAETPQGDDPDEVLTRTYRLTLSCLPFPRTPEAVEISALPAAKTTGGTADILVDSCDTTTGWTRADVMTTLAAQTIAGYTMVTGTSTRNFATIRRNGAIPNVDSATGDDTRFLVLGGYLRSQVRGRDGRLANSYSGDVEFTVDGRQITPVEMTYRRQSGLWGAVLYLPDGVSTYVTVRARAPQGSTATQTIVGVDSIRRRGDRPYTSTYRQQHRQIPVYGTARTEVSVQVRGLDAMGEGMQLGPETLVYTAPPGYGLQPPLTTWRTDGLSRVTDGTMMSGGYSEMNNTVPDTYELPADQIPPGNYLLVARLRAQLAGTHTVTARASMTVDAVPDLSPTTIDAASAALTYEGGGGWFIKTIGRLRLPGAAIADGTAATVTITLACAPDRLDLDEAWLFNIDTGQLSLVDTLGAEQLRIDTASLDHPYPRYWIGTADDTVLVDAGERVQSWEQHMITPDVANVFVVTGYTSTAHTSLVYHPRWHTHAAALPDDVVLVDNGTGGEYQPPVPEVAV